MENAVYGSDYDWQYLTTNDGRTNKANRDGSINWPRGKMLGGSSNINAMIYIKGVRHEYEQWYNEGNKDWHPDVIEAYFKKAESYQNQNLLNNSAINMEYGHDGPLVVNVFNSTYKALVDKVVKSWNELGFTEVIDLNLPGVFKSGITTCTAANGIRRSAEISYIYPIQKRPNLKLLKNTLATKLLIDVSNNNVYGVEIERKGRKYKVNVSKEVIVSAGAINSPQLLMLSGIGPKAHLESRNINCQVDLPSVGQHMQDHLAIPVTIFGDSPNAPDIATENFDAIQYLYNRTGHLAEHGFSDVISFYSSSRNFTYPEFQNHLILVWKNQSSKIASYFSDRFRYNEPIPSFLTKLNKKNTLYMFFFHLLHPESRGNISLKTNDPHDHPLIYPNYFLNEKDLDTAVMGLRMLTKIVQTKYFSSIKAFLGRMKWPECDKCILDSDDYWRCVCINMVETVYHPVGSCKMGPNPHNSVVDSHLSVHGVTSLRVIDASIMPQITSGNTNGPTYMIGERGVDLVKKDHNL